ncbi:MAG: shikimate kinase [Candidatus Gastranaerophilales bacterium]
MKNKIALIGMMGAGKSTIADELKKELADFELVDVDKKIENETGQTITQIFIENSEEYFRKLERDCIAEIFKPDDKKLIIALGGGAFENEENQKLILENSTVFYLYASASDIYERIKTQLNRPLLKNNKNVENIANIINKRKFNYEKAHHTIDTDGKNFYNIVTEILEKI